MSSPEKQVVQVVQEVLGIFQAGVNAAAPEHLFTERVIGVINKEAETARNIRIVCTGKAGLSMLAAIGEKLAFYDALVVVPEGYRESLPKQYILPAGTDILEAGHPIPSRRSAEAGQRVLNQVNECGKGDLMIMLLSGGSSALTALPIQQLSLRDLQDVTDRLVKSGADIHQINTVRRYLTQLGGGKLARAAHPARIITFVISDVPGDALHVIGSGPTVPDPHTPEEASTLVDEFIEEGVLKSRIKAMLDQVARNPSDDDPCFSNSKATVIGTNNDAMHGAAEAARMLGYRVELHEDKLSGEARACGQNIVRYLADPPEKPTCHIWGGETTVTVRGNGTGGRNQELALAAGISLAESETPGIVLSGGTDGIDGPTDAAGAWSSAASVGRLGISAAQKFLDRNDSYHAHHRMRTLIKTGPTHTNVMDIAVAIRLPYGAKTA